MSSTEECWKEGDEKKIKDTFSSSTGEALERKLYVLSWHNAIFMVLPIPFYFHFCISLNCLMYFQNCKMYLSKFQNIFVKIAKYICLNCKMYVSKSNNVFDKNYDLCLEMGQRNLWSCQYHSIFISVFHPMLRKVKNFTIVCEISEKCCSP